MDRPNGAHRLLRVTGGGFTILAEDQITYDLKCRGLPSADAGADRLDAHVSLLGVQRRDCSISLGARTGKVGDRFPGIATTGE